MTVPGFTDGALGEARLLIADAAVPAAGAFAGEVNALLWTRQVVHDGTLRAVAFDPAAAMPEQAYGPAGFQHVHAVAEQVATALGIGAVDVAVLPGADSASVTREYDGWRISARATDDVVVLITDADLTSLELHDVLAQALGSVPWVERGGLMLASGVSQVGPTAAEVAVVVADLLDALPMSSSPTVPTVPTHESTVHV